MELFEFTKILFEDPESWKNIPSGEKRKHFFMCTRRFAIQHPMQAQALQHQKINPAGTIDFWQRFMHKIYRQRTPNWMYTRGIKKAKETKERKTNVSETTIKEFAKFNRIDVKSVQDALEFYPDPMLKEIKHWEKLIQQ